MLFKLFLRFFRPQPKPLFDPNARTYSCHRRDDEGLAEFIARSNRESKAYFAQFN